jgi:hypothetical protein|tara:strand:- start:333 stop:758 length:426 start_codon:yes stop_codon:yes gene_type:complete
MAIGTAATKINSKEMQIWVHASANTWTLLQNARVSISHPVFREPTTSGGVVTYTGAADHSISGSLLFSTDSWTGTYGFDALSTTTTSEVPARTWAVKFTDAATTATTLSFPNCKLTSLDISKSTEGGVKVDISLVCPEEPT